MARCGRRVGQDRILLEMIGLVGRMFPLAFSARALAIARRRRDRGEPGVGHAETDSRPGAAVSAG